MYPIDVYIWGSSNGRTAAFEAVNWGSNPCPQARKIILFIKIILRAWGRKCDYALSPGIRRP